MKPRTRKPRKRDWDDWLSPVLVKELRQGLRDPLFVLAFIVFQVGLVATVILTVDSSTDSSLRDDQQAAFAGGLASIFVILLPLRAITALSSEVKQNTLETLLVTRMSVWRVLLGKWAAFGFQSFLVATTALPYLIARYFVGGDDLVVNLEFLLALFLSSLFLLALSVSISAVASLFVRLLVLAGAAGGVALLVAWTLDPPSVSFLTQFGTLVGASIFFVFVPWAAFDLAASTVGLAAENRAWRRRLLSALLLIVAYFYCWWEKSGLVYVIALHLFLGFCYLELARPDILLGRNLTPFVRFHFPGRVLAYCLLPGWPSALLFTLLTFPVAISGLYSDVAGDSTTEQSSIINFWGCYVTAIFGSVLMPLVVIVAFVPGLSYRAFVIGLINLFLVGLARVLFFMVPGMRDFLGLVPCIGTGVQVAIAHGDLLRYSLEGGFVDLLLISFLLAAASPWFHHFDQLWQKQLDKLGGKT